MAGRVAGRWRPAVGAPVAYGNIRSRYIVVFSSPPALARFAYRGPPRNGNYQNAPFTQDPDCSARFRPPLHWPGLVPVNTAHSSLFPLKRFGDAPPPPPPTTTTTTTHPTAAQRLRLPPWRQIAGLGGGRLTAV